MSTLAPSVESPRSPAKEIMLASGNLFSLAGLTLGELEQLQWEQEKKFAQAIRSLPKASAERALVTGQAYDTVSAILAAQQSGGGPLYMGLDPRYVKLVLKLLKSQIDRGMGQPRLFEVGFGGGALLKEVAEHGYHVSGIEVSPQLRDQAEHLLGERYADRLLLGDLREVSKTDLSERPSLVYWNDVFEHICPDEIGDYVRHICKLLQPGGSLVTITPNWLLRPSDVTALFCPPRTEAHGLHFKEYRLSEVTRLLRQSGFRHVATPLFVTHKNIYLCGGGLRLAKRIVEPLIDRLPLKAAHLLCRGLGLSYTVATKR